MNNNIKLEIEKYVLDEFKYIRNLDPTEDGYSSAKNSSIKDINTLVELLQKEDVNNDNSIYNHEKLKNEIAKLEKEHQLNLKKLESENNKNKNNFDLEKEKIKNSYEIDNKKIENDNNKVDNELRKINYDYELSERKLESENIKVDIEVRKVNNDYEINKEKIKIENIKNEVNSQVENRKIKITEDKNISDIDLRNKELKIDAEKDIKLRNDRLISVLIDGVTVIIPIIFYNIWMNKGFKFEETGTYTSNTFKNLFSRFKPTRG